MKMVNIFWIILEFRGYFMFWFICGEMIKEFKGINEII